MPDTQSKKIVTRFAPSPTGFLHAGAYRTAIFSYLYARHHGGTFVLRIEDTDKERSKKEYEDNILDSLSWLGLEYDVFVRQSENVVRHKTLLEQMIRDGFAYVSKEEAKDGSGVIREIVRYKNPNQPITFQDEIKGSITMDTTDLGDFVLAKNINEPLFHFAVVVDDFDAGVSHVIRGEDHVSNTPRQILIQRAIGAPQPTYAHLPLVLGSDKLKLSKRRGALALTEYRERGYLPDAILNMVALIGWNPGTEQEIFTKNDLIASFELSRVQKSGAMFNPEKLDWINKEHIKLLSEDAKLALFDQFLPVEITSLPEYRSMRPHIAPILLERLSHFDELRGMANDGELDYYFSPPTFPPEKLFWKEEHDVLKLLTRLKHVKSLFENIPVSTFTKETTKEAIWDFAEGEGRGSVLWPLRFALSGKERSPDPFTLAGILGKDETLRRIDSAIAMHHE